METRLEIYNQIKKLIKESTNLDGKINAEYFKKELLIEIFPEITEEEVVL